MGQCRTLDADVTIGCYYGDYSLRDIIPTSLFIWNTFFLPHLFASFFKLVKVIVWTRVRFGEKLHGNRKIARGEAECYLNCCKCKFSPKLHSGPCYYLLIVMTYLH